MARNQKITLKSIPAKGGSGSDTATVLSLQGELTIDYAVQLRDFLLENLNKQKAFALKVNNVESIDITGIQLIQRFYWDAKEMGKPTTIELKLSEEQRQLLEKTGFSEFINLSAKQ
jgi:anti-anti-sigma factor